MFIIYHLKKRISFFTFLLGLFIILVLFYFATSVSVKAQTRDTADCGRWDASSVTSSNFYSGYGVPWDVFSPSKLLMRTNCTGDGIVLSLGDESQNRYIWGKAYVSKEGGAWQEVDLSGGKRVGGWLLGSAAAVLHPEEISSSGSNYILSYVCTFQGGVWKCGCRDAGSCNESGYWQLQEVQNPAVQKSTESTESAEETAFRFPNIFYPSNYVVSRGEHVVITGGGLEGENKVLFEGYGTVPASVSSEGTNISFSVPFDIPYGRYDMFAEGSAGKSNPKFIVVKDPLASAPVILRSSAEVVHPGDSVTLSGSGFDLQKNQIRTNVGLVSGVASSDGRALTFIFPYKPAPHELPPPMMKILESKGISKEMFAQMQKTREALAPSQTPGTVYVVNKGGISNRKELTIIMK